MSIRIYKYTKPETLYDERIDIKIKVNATTRKLKAVWTPMSSNDLRAFHGVEGEKDFLRKETKEN